MRTPTLALLVLGAVCLIACGKDDPAAEQPKPAAPVKPRSNLVKISTPIPYGAKLECPSLFDPAAASAAIGDMIEIRDRKSSDADASAVCAFMRSGQPPT